MRVLNAHRRIEETISGDGDDVAGGAGVFKDTAVGENQKLKPAQRCGVFGDTDTDSLIEYDLYIGREAVNHDWNATRSSQRVQPPIPANHISSLTSRANFKVLSKLNPILFFVWSIIAV